MEEANAFLESSKMPLSFFTKSGLFDVKTAQKYRVSKSTSLLPASCQGVEKLRHWSSCSFQQGQRSKAPCGTLPFQNQLRQSVKYLRGCQASYECLRL